MYLVAIGWLYVVVMMAVAEALSTQGTVLGAVITFVLYGLLPISIVLYVMGSPMRRRKRLAADAAGAAEGSANAAETAAPATAAPPPTSTAAMATSAGATAAGAGSGGVPARTGNTITIDAAAVAPDGSGLAPGHAVPAERKER